MMNNGFKWGGFFLKKMYLNNDNWYQLFSALFVFSFIHLLFVSFKQLDGMPCCLSQDAIWDGCCLQECSRRISSFIVLGCYSIGSNICKFYHLPRDGISLGKAFKNLIHNPCVSKLFS